MSSIHLSPNWLEPPPHPVRESVTPKIGHISELVAQLAESGSLARAIIDVCDANDQFWRAELCLQSSPPDVAPFSPATDGGGRPYICGLELTFDDPFPSRVFQHLQSTFPEGDIHVPPMIIRNNFCYPPSIGDNLELGVFFPLD